MTISEFNPDAMSRDELMAFWAQYNRCGRKAALAFLECEISGRKDAAKILHALANYACNKSIAMGCRERGDVVGAQGYELVCENIYSRLPADVRW